MEKSDKVRIMAHFFPRHEAFCHSLLSSTLLCQRRGSVEKSDKVRIMPHFFPRHEPFVILYLVLHFSARGVEVWKSLTKSG